MPRSHYNQTQRQGGGRWGGPCGGPCGGPVAPVEKVSSAPDRPRGTIFLQGSTGADKGTGRPHKHNRHVLTFWPRVPRLPWTGRARPGATGPNTAHCHVIAWHWRGPSSPPAVGPTGAPYQQGSTACVQRSPPAPKQWAGGWGPVLCRRAVGGGRWAQAAGIAQQGGA